MTPSADSHWILIRGLAREARHWGEFAQDLEKELAATGLSARVDALDLPGAGRFSEMRSPVTMKEIAIFVREKYLELRRRMREQGQVPPPKSYLVSISLGGMVACDWLERWPDDFSGVVLINTSFKGFSPIHHRLTPGSLKHFVRIFSAKSVQEREYQILEMISNRPETYDSVSREWATIAESRPVTYENFGRQLVAAALYQPRLPKPHQPVLLLNSEKDRMVDPACSTEIAKSWGVPLVKHPTAGHDLPLDEPGFTAREIAKWSSLLNKTPDRA